MTKANAFPLQVTQAYQQAIVQSGQIYTTDYVLDETFTLFFRRLPASRAEQSMKRLTAAFSTSNFHLICISEEGFSKTVELRSRFLDKPLISFTDLTSMVVMRELNITTILTEDAHFTHVGMGFQLLP